MADMITLSDGVVRGSLLKDDAAPARDEAHDSWRSGSPVSQSLKGGLLPDITVALNPSGSQSSPKATPDALPVFSKNKVEPPAQDSKCPGNADYLAFIERTSRLIYDPSELGDIAKLKTQHPCIASTDEAVRLADEAVKVANDPYTDVLPKREALELDRSIEGHFVGIGVQIGRQKESDTGPVTIFGVYAGSPAEAAGIKKGDLITSVDGDDVDKMKLDQVSDLLTGEANTKLNLTVSRQGQALDFGVTRQELDIPALTDKAIGDIAYIHLEDLSQDDSALELQGALERHANAKAVILDLRDNPGGQVISALKAASLIMQNGEIMKVRSRVDSDPGKPEYEVERYFVTPSGLKVTTDDVTQQIDQSERLPDLVDVPLVVLTNENTASAAELLAGALKDNGEATLIGKTTFGKGVGQHIMSDLPGESKLMVTNFRFFTPDGSWIGDGHKRRFGIKPNIVVENPANAEIGSGDDLQLNAAIAHLKERMGKPSGAK